MPRFSANLTLLFTEVPFLDRFAAAAAAGFRAVEFVSPYAHPAEAIAARLRAHDLEVSVFNLPPGDWEHGDRGLACDPRRAAELRDSIPLAIAYARALRCPRVHCMAGIRPAGVHLHEIEATYRASLRLAADALAREELELLVEAINDRDMPGYHVTTARQALEVIGAIGSPNLRFQLDAYHLHVMGEPPLETLERNLGQVGHVQIADAPGRHEPGTGEIDLAGFLRRLDALGYRGWVGCEYRPATTTEAGLGWMRPWMERAPGGRGEA
ncbi:2-oxo-tetronate isomerase [Anaeromyxobacter oryzae]|uniref:Hydroxypyruvate isomerase n=1 Tax=Anaeromyxobacter oryzae TaxID=2918170 RepID=A0ABM7X166_9BACT|nr:2-oxo-tetronate isomerase [Anaeromyxobacter oryzae]BDG05504.1 hydroxypyruvate isomerase [Anaeromyxobacter oryzae]